MATRTKSIWQHGGLVVVPLSRQDLQAEQDRRQKAVKDAAWLAATFRLGDLVDHIDWRGKPARHRVTRFSGGEFPEIKDMISLGGGNAQSVYSADDVRRGGYKIVGKWNGQGYDLF